LHQAVLDTLRVQHRFPIADIKRRLVHGSLRSVRSVLKRKGKSRGNTHIILRSARRKVALLRRAHRTKACPERRRTTIVLGDARCRARTRYLGRRRRLLRASVGHGRGVRGGRLGVGVIVGVGVLLTVLALVPQ
jgi:hypothetical protein